MRENWLFPEKQITLIYGPMQLDEKFYDSIVALTDDMSDEEPPLEQYLRSLLGILQRMVEQTNFDEAEFLNMLAEAYGAPPEAFQEDWINFTEDRDRPALFADTMGTLKRQVAELRSFRDEDVATAQIYLDNGACWNNFATSSYLECAAAGAVDNLRIRPRPDAPPTIDWNDIRFFLGLGQSYE